MSSDQPSLIVLGIAQDAGVPQAGSVPEEFAAPDRRRFAVSLGLVDGDGRWLFEATPDFKYQLARFDHFAPPGSKPGLNGIFLTHAHVGHYTGLMMLGHEVMGASSVPVYAMPRMAEFLRTNGPWSQLVRLENIELRPLAAGQPVQISDRLVVTPFLVPHRQEFSEVVGYRIDGPHRSVLFIPDIDSWREWDERGVRLEDVLQEVDVAYLDATFYANGEIPGRDMSGFPHPFVVTTMRRLEGLSAEERAKVRFIHLNHTNPVLKANSAARKHVEASGFRVAREGEVVEL